MTSLLSNRQRSARLLASLFVAAVVLWSAMQSPQQPAAAIGAGINDSPVAPRTTLRVGMWTLWHDREVLLTPLALGNHTRLRTCEQCNESALQKPAAIRADGDQLALTMNGKTARVVGVWLTHAVTLAAHGEIVTLDNPLTITAHSGALIIVVTLPVESYVEKVVASESNPHEGTESLKALAIVVRSFALHQAHGHADYDLCDSTHCQLLHWGGTGARGPAAHAATLATAGETLWFHGQRALAYFGKDCGGHTASPDEIWPHAKPASYLPSRLDRYCAGDGGNAWASEITHSDLTSALAARGLARPGWQNLTIARRGDSGRAVALQADATEIPAEAFRLAVGASLGWNRLPSTWFEVSRQGDQFLFHGRGWGNGVGLCQKGAAAMAEQGRSTQDILAQYFPGTDAADEATGHAWKNLPGERFVLETLDAGDAAFLPELNRARAEAEERSGLNAATPFAVRAFATTQAFRDATLAPGWVAAFTEGNWIGTQPLRTLATRQLLAPTMRHEFLHALIERQAGPQAPLWLREGLVEFWGHEKNQQNTYARPSMPLEATDAALAHATSEAESAAAHRSAESYAAKLLAHYGRAQTLQWLRSGVPAGVAAALGQR